MEKKEKGVILEEMNRIDEVKEKIFANLDLIKGFLFSDYLSGAVRDAPPPPNSLESYLKRLHEELNEINKELEEICIFLMDTDS